MGIGQLLTMPLFFASNAIYPIEIMPQWLKIISKINPLTYIINALRSLMIAGAPATSLLNDFAIVIGASALFILIAGSLYKRVIV